MASAPLPPLLPLPTDRAELRAWAARYDVDEVLGRQARETSHGLAGPYLQRLSYSPRVTIEEIVAPEEKHPLRGYFHPRELAALTSEVRARFAQFAAARVAEAAAEAADHKRWAEGRARLSPALVPLVDALLEARQESLAKLPAPFPRARGSLHVTLSSNPFQATISRAATVWSPEDVGVELAAWPEPPTFTCSVDSAWRECHHRPAALAALLDHLVLRLETDPRAPAFLAELQRAPWERFIEFVEKGAEPELESELDPEVRLPLPERPEKIVWSMSFDHRQLEIVPTRHTMLKKGGWSKGSPLARDPNYAMRLKQLPAVDIQAIELWAGAQYAQGRMKERLQSRVLELLVGHPEVLLVTGLKVVPLQLERSPLAVHVERDAEGHLTPRAQLAGSETLGRRALEALGPMDSQALVFDSVEDAPLARAFLVQVDPEAVTMLRALERFRPRLPATAAPQLMATLAPLENKVSLELPPELEGQLLAPDLAPLLRLRLEPTAVGGKSQAVLDLAVVMQPLPGGPVVPPGEGALELSRFEGARRLRVRRDPAAEAAAVTALLARLPLQHAEAPTRWERRLASIDDALDLVRHLQSLPNEGPEAVRVEWLKESAHVLREAKPNDLRVAISDKRDWFGLVGEIAIDNERVELAILLEAARRQARYVEVGAGRWMALSRELREKLGAAADVVQEGRKGLEVSPVAADALADLLDAAGELKLSTRWRTFVERLAAARSRQYAVPKPLAKTLRPYQKEGFAWLMRLAGCGLGAVLADDMGLGKTLQALAVLEARAAEGPALVVAPTSVCFNWEREAARFTSKVRVARYGGGAAERAAMLAKLKPRDVVIASYGLLVEDAERFQGVRWATVILDEAQALKNPATRRARAARDLQADWIAALTGTPVENHVGELWSLFRIVAPGLLGSWEQFRIRFATPIEKYRDRERRVALGRVVRPFILRRTKDEVARDLPSRTEITLPVVLSAGERQLYDGARMAALVRLTEKKGPERGDQRFEVLAALTRLRQLACHPRLYDPNTRERSSKLEKLLDLVEQLRDEGHRALIFSQFTSHLALVRAALEAQGISYRYLDGSCSPSQRETEVDAFQRGEGDLFLISLKAGGTGLNLTAADYVIHLDPWWNPAVEDQATNRAHRIGQDKPVTVYRLVSQGTIEEAILALHADKRDLVAGLLEGTDRAGKLSTEQLVDLIRTGATGVEDEAADDLAAVANTLEDAAAQTKSAPHVPSPAGGRGSG